MGNPAGVRRDFAALETRRIEAARSLRAGLSQAEVARKVGVHRQSVSRWARELEQSGLRGLRKAERTGRPPRLSAAQLRDLERALKRGDYLAPNFAPPDTNLGTNRIESVIAP